MASKHIVIDARIRRASTGRPVDRLLEHIQSVDKTNRYTVLLEPDDDWKPKSKRFSVVPCRFKQFSFNPLQQVLYAAQLYRLKPDLAHFTMTGQQPLFYFGRQTTFTHDLTMFKFARPGRLPKWLHYLRMRGYRLLVWSAHRKAAKILVPSEYVRDAVAKFHLFTNRKIVVTPEAADPPVSTKSKIPEAISPNSSLLTPNSQLPTPPSSFPSPHSPLPTPHSSLPTPISYLLYIGSAFPHKNLRRLVQAFGQLKAKNPDLKLVFAGKLEYHAKKLRRWAKKQPSGEDIIFTGFVSEAELKWLYENAGAYVFPSLSEGFGLPGLEAMAHGCPVVSSNSTCLPEVYGDAATYFEPRDVEDMAAKVKKVLGSKDLRKDLVNKGYKQIKKYSWRRMAEQTAAIFDSILQKR